MEHSFEEIDSKILAKQDLLYLLKQPINNPNQRPINFFVNYLSNEDRNKALSLTLDLNEDGVNFEIESNLNNIKSMVMDITRAYYYHIAVINGSLDDIIGSLKRWMFIQILLLGTKSLLIMIMFLQVVHLLYLTTNKKLLIGYLMVEL